MKCNSIIWHFLRRHCISSVSPWNKSLCHNSDYCDRLQLSALCHYCLRMSVKILNSQWGNSVWTMFGSGIGLQHNGPNSLGHAPGEYCSLLMEGDQRINLVNYIFSSRACRPHTLVQWTGKCVAVQWSMWITKKHANWPAGCKTFGLPKEDQWENKSWAEELVHH